MDGAFGNVDAEYMESEVPNGVKLMFKVDRAFREDESEPGIVAIAEQIREELVNFKPHLPRAVALRNEGMRDRHWEQISEKVGKEVSPEMERFTLRCLLDMGLLENTDDIAEVGTRTGKEFALEKTLRKMKQDWEQVQFDIKEKYRTTGTYVLKGPEEAMALLDEHTVTAQAMQVSIFKKPFEEVIDERATRLFLVSETLDEWLKSQASWRYLQAIFDSDGIMKHLPAEGKRFNGVDIVWHQAMNQAYQN